MTDELAEEIIQLQRASDTPPSDLQSRYAEVVRSLQRSNTDLEQFAYAASHDLQAPIRKIRQYSKMLMEDCGGEMDPECRRYLSSIESASTHAYHLIDGLLSFSRIGHKLADAGPVDLNEVVKRSEDVLHLDIEEKGARITVDEPLPVVLGDWTLLSQVFQNLIGNAIKFRREEVPPRIRITWVRVGDTAVIRVTDNSEGFDMVHCDRVFSLFQRLGGHKNGLGLGLAVCRKIVESHGGQIRVEWSQPGVGTTVRFTLQIHKEQS